MSMLMDLPIGSMSLGTNQQVSGLGGATAIANANVALAKYWGKRDETLNLPYTSSISITLAGLETTAHVRYDARLRDDVIRMNGAEPDPAEAHRVCAFVDRVRQLAGQQTKAEVDITSNFPVAAGLASSA